MSITYKFEFHRELNIDDVHDTLILSVVGTEAIHGRAALRLDGWFHLDKRLRICEIEAATETGQTLARLFAGYLGREFGWKSWSVQRIESAPQDENGGTE